MTLTAFPNGQGPLLGAFPNLPQCDLTSSSIGAIDANGELIAAVGYMLLSSGPGTSKTISPSGGKVFFRTGAVTWADGATVVRVGVQDVAGTGFGDGTFDVFADISPGVETITANVCNGVAMESGTKTINHGDLVAVVLSMTNRGGTDSLTVFRHGSAGVSPNSIVNAGKVGSNPLMTIEFDDGTVGFFDVACFAFMSDTSALFGSGSTPDEHALILEWPVPFAAVGLYGRLSSLSATDDFEMILYSDPLGTPVAERTIVQDMDLAATTSNAAHFGRPFTSPYTVPANTPIAIALRPTTANTIGYARLNFGSGNGVLRKATMLGATAYLATRSNQTGAFGSADTTILPLFGVWMGQVDDGAGGGAEVASVFAG